MVTATMLNRTIMRGRAAMAGLYTDRCKIERVGEIDTSTFNKTTMKYDAATRATVYEGPCRMQVKADINSNVVETTAGEREWTYLTAQLQLPVERGEALLIDEDTVGNPADVTVDDVVTFTVCLYDSSMVGREFNLAGPYHKSHAVYRRFRVREPVV